MTKQQRSPRVRHSLLCQRLRLRIHFQPSLCPAAHPHHLVHFQGRKRASHPRRLVLLPPQFQLLHPNRLAHFRSRAEQQEISRMVRHFLQFQRLHLRTHFQLSPHLVQHNYLAHFRRKRRAKLQNKACHHLAVCSLQCQRLHLHHLECSQRRTRENQLRRPLSQVVLHSLRCQRQHPNHSVYSRRKKILNQPRRPRRQVVLHSFR
mmetsp:Transcript_46512/g.98662  ORF Transcript_46512/g.98662 Transcript_46512/m.98662 type:complete len:205 (-) Transcript_46512:3576-4190(-)